MHAERGPVQDATRAHAVEIIAKVIAHGLSATRIEVQRHAREKNQEEHDEGGDECGVDEWNNKQGKI